MPYFIILTHGRCGSNLVWRTLNQHPQLEVRTDVFNRNKRTGSFAKMWFGFDGCSVHHSDRKYMPDLFYHLRGVEGLRILLLRRNPLTRLVSWELAQKTGHSLHEGYGDAQVEIEIEPPIAFRNFQDIVEMEEFAKVYFSEKPQMEVWYESLCKNWNDTMRDIQCFLGVNTIPLTPAINKQDDRSLRYRLKNYDQLRDYAAGTQWSYLFEESHE